MIISCSISNITMPRQISHTKLMILEFKHSARKDNLIINMLLKVIQYGKKDIIDLKDGVDACFYSNILLKSEGEKFNT